MICHYWYFKDIGFKHQPYVCNGCHDFSMIVQKLDDFVILRVKGVDYRCCVVNMSKKDKGKAAKYYDDNKEAVKIKRQETSIKI